MACPLVRVTKPKKSNNIIWLIVLVLITLMNTCLVKEAHGQIAPALFVFGDSLVDVGNNNHLPFSLVKANFPHNGIDFLNHKPSGRFSNGKNAADFVAEKLGVPTSPPYLSMKHNENPNFLSGVSFASGGSGILDHSDEVSSIAMEKQIEYLERVKEMMVQEMGQENVTKIQSKSIMLIVIGSNDILRYFGPSQSKQTKKSPPQQLVDSMLLSIKAQLKRIYENGGRKFAMIGVGPVGCCPSQRDKNKTEACNEEANYWASKYNQGLFSILQQYKSSLLGFQYSFFDTYTVLHNVIQQPSTYGFKEVKAACCGLGELKAKIACIPISSLCSNRDEHVFWDFYHPSQAAARTLIDIAFDGPSQYTFPVNIRQLATS